MREVHSRSKKLDSAYFSECERVEWLELTSLTSQPTDNKDREPLSAHRPTAMQTDQSEACTTSDNTLYKAHVTVGAEQEKWQSPRTFECGRQIKFAQDQLRLQTFVVIPKYKQNQMTTESPYIRSRPKQTHVLDYTTRSLACAFFRSFVSAGSIPSFSQNRFLLSSPLINPPMLNGSTNESK